ncbi:inorganic phosphate transporter [Aurantibacter aestuarii]|uniref:Phosphate transporter n=1 Tax=Aurantibacter aestuarii TaxID=1266046 RepID=A0A2T1NC26_9FLAO|nr:inorganic phosphate transporter [Aurantibacter aestuarii]PSG89991.1 phosphate:sodium symporter [Aurantibacter aestuarii]
MDNIYLIMIIALAVLAIADLIVGVSNDAVNFLNSAIGSKAVSFKTIMIVASFGVALGAIFSSGLMEVARKGIFHPEEFMFNEIMIIFMAVMITDILLLDFFNSVGMPTSTTVSIVFELLGAAVAIAAVKIYNDEGGFSDLITYINTETATEIILGILLSVVIAFTIGAIIQWVTRVLLSFNFENKPLAYEAIFGGLALTALTYFIFIKGIKGTPYSSQTFSFTNGLELSKYLAENTLTIIAVSFVVSTILSVLFVKLFKWNTYKIIILVGTFALALAFAGNDLVNFIGVPITALKSYEFWQASGLSPDALNMSFLSGKVDTPELLLLIAGIIMVATLWFSSKAKDVVKTSLDLSSQSETKERFQPNFLSRHFVRLAIFSSNAANKILPETLNNRIEKQFTKVALTNKKSKDEPAFDLVRAAVNLMVAAVLISLATSMKLPLSTTYVTFMVAMGTSLADRAWGSESAVYRVAGVLNVIAGWFFTAIIAFVAAGIVAWLLNLNLNVMLPILLVITAIIIVRNYISHSKKQKSLNEVAKKEKIENQSVQGVILESSDHIVNVLHRSSNIYNNMVEGLAKQDLSILKKNKKQVNKLTNEVEDLRDNIFFFIKNLDDSSVGASNFYINILGHLQDMTQSLEYITKISHKHINNNHKKLKFSQIKELQEINKNLNQLFEDTKIVFAEKKFADIDQLLVSTKSNQTIVKEKINKQIERTRNEESSPKNTTLYFSLLVKTKELLKSNLYLLEEYNDSFDEKIKL